MVCLRPQVCEVSAEGSAERGGCSRHRVGRKAVASASMAGVAGGRAGRKLKLAT